jgi:hypothetical protein
VTLTLTNDATLAWQWQTEYRLETATNGNGTVTAADGWYPAGASTVLTATASEHWHFARWEGDTNGCALADNVITAAMTQARAITAVFEIDRHTLTVTSAHGGAHPGTETADYGTALEQWVTNSPVSGGVGTQYVCTAAQVTSNAFTQVSPTNVTLTLTNDATLAWQWQTNYWLDTEAGPHGDVTPADSWTNAGANVEVTAVPHLYYHFTGWTGSGTNCIVAGDSSLSTVTVAVTMPVWLSADFGENLATNETPEWWLALHGWTNGFDAAALDDWDNDGMPTWAEFHADTLPRDGDSVLAITGLSWNVSGVHVMWKGGSNAWQCLESRRDLVSTGEHWLAIFTNPPPTSVTTNYHYGAGTNGVWFFRLKAWR